VQGLARNEEPFADPSPGRRVEQDLEDRRRVDDDHRPCRAALTASAGETRGMLSVAAAEEGEELEQVM
jgi:hypothetical protein